MADDDNVLTGARARARASVRGEIVTEARSQLADDGPAGLSLRAVARALGMASSAVYRYVASRDELLTLLIIEAYDEMGAAAETAASAAADRPAVDRWVAVAGAVRRWALAHPHEYALVYGTPVPGYEAPEDTVAAGTRVSLCLVGIVADAVAAADAPLEPAVADLPDEVVADLARLRVEAGVAIPDHLRDDLLVATLLAWTQLFGLLSFELFHQTRGVVTDHEAFFALAAASMAERIGLPTA